MEQPKITIKDTHGKDYGEKPVTAIHWNDGEIISITVNFLGSDMYPMVMIPDGSSSSLSFKNVRGGLDGEMVGRRKKRGAKSPSMKKRMQDIPLESRSLETCLEAVRVDGEI